MKDAKKPTGVVIALLIGLCCQPFSLAARSVHRPIDPLLPTIKVRWSDDTAYEQLRDSHLEHYALFSIYDHKHFHDHLLPTGTLAFRDNPHISVTTELLNKLVEELLDEVKNHKKKYTHFTILQNKDFNRRKACGLLVVRFKEFPFVVKLFIETPNSFTHPDCKGFLPVIFFYMGGGVNRHLSGFTRIKNLEHINKRLSESPEWATTIKTPRKWFWLPKSPTWIDIEGINVGESGHAHSVIPGTYAIIADEITSEQIFSIKNPDHCKLALKLCNYLDLYVDPHIDNFRIERGSGMIAIVDTEHFPTIVGFKEKRFITNYFDWYIQMMGKCAEDSLFRSKLTSKRAQKKKSTLALL